MSGDYSLPKNHVKATLEVKPPGKKARAVIYRAVQHEKVTFF